MGGDSWCNGGGLFTLSGEKLKHFKALADLYRTVAMLWTGFGGGDARDGRHDRNALTSVAA